MDPRLEEGQNQHPAQYAPAELKPEGDTDIIEIGNRARVDCQQPCLNTVADGGTSLVSAGMNRDLLTWRDTWKRAPAIPAIVGGTLVMMVILS